MYIEHSKVPGKGYFWALAINLGITVWPCGFCLTSAGI